jgi:hypothetical protein
LATLARRARAVVAEYDVLRRAFDAVVVDLVAVAFTTAGFFAVFFAVAAEVEVFFVVDDFCVCPAANDEAGKPTARVAASTHDRWIVFRDQFRIKGQPLARQLVRSCFGIVAKPL